LAFLIIIFLMLAWDQKTLGQTVICLIFLKNFNLINEFK